MRINTAQTVMACELTLQRLAVPFSQFGRCVVSALQEFHQSHFGRVSGSDIVVREQVLFELQMVESCLRANLTLREAGWLRRCIRVERRSLNVAAAGPEACA